MTKQTGVPLRMVGEDGNAFAILGRAQRALKKAGMGDQVEAFIDEAAAGDYDHLLRTCMVWFDVDAVEDEDEDDWPAPTYDRHRFSGATRMHRESYQPNGYNFKACPCECNSGGFCGGCGHAGCGGRR